jgi:hypothetical protein
MPGRTTRMTGLAIFLAVFSMLGPRCGSQSIFGHGQSGAAAKEESMTPEASISANAKSSDILVQLTIVNRGTNPFPLLKWNLPNDGRLTTSLFEIERDGRVVEYKGVMVKRAVTAADYMDLAPGRKYRASISLAQGYDVSPKGRYSIQYKAWNQSLAGSAVIPLTSNIVVVEK